MTEHTITDINQLEEELTGIREKGYAFEDQELRKGVRRIVAPIYDHRDHLAGCVGVAATIFSFEMDDRESLSRQVVETANQISYGMGNAK